MQHGFKSEEYNKAANDLKDTEIIKGELDLLKTVEGYKILAGTKDTQMILKQKADYQKAERTFLNNYPELVYAARVKGNTTKDKNGKTQYDLLSDKDKASIDKRYKDFTNEITNMQNLYPYANVGVPDRQDAMSLLRLAKS
jgi:hypothetical protein